MSLIDEPTAWENDSEGQRLKISIKDLILGEDYDRIDATYPTADSEVYTYKNDAVTVRVVTVTYTDATKKDLLTLVAT